MKKINSAPVRPALQSKRRHNVSMQQHYERKGTSCSPMRDDNFLSTDYNHNDLSKHYYTPPRGEMANQQHEQHPKSVNHQQKKSKRSLLSRASKQFNQKLHNKDKRPHNIHTEDNDNEEGAYFREAKDPSPTNEHTYAVLLDKGDRNFDSIGKGDRLPEDNWTEPRIVEVNMGVTPTPAFPNETNKVAVTTVPQSLPQTLQRRSSAATTPPILEKYYQGESRQEINCNEHMRNVDDQRQPQHKLIDSSKDNEIKQLRQKLQEKEDLKHKVDELEHQLAQREQEMEMETTKLKKELRKKEQNLEQMQANTNAKAQEYEIKVERDIEAYKRKCSTYREQLLQKEREIARVEQTLYNERKKLLSLQSENETLINVAEERVGNVMTSEKAKSSELKRYKDQFEKYRNERAKMEQALHNERKKVLMLEKENEILIKAAEEKVGNVMTLEKAKSSELKNYKDQCEMYRQKVLGLERKVLSTESALISTSSIATTLEEEKRTISSELSQAEANVATLKSELSDKDIKIDSLQSEIANLQSTRSNLEAALRSAQTKIKLENEHASILDQWKEKSMLVEKLQISSAKYKEIEDENALLRRKNDELAAKEMQLKEELSKSEVFSPNTERLRKMLSDSESYISSLQDDLSLARTTHHQQLTDARAKYSSEIHSITAQLETQINAKRELETKNNNLEDEVLSLKRKLPEIEDLRCSLSESTQKVSSLKRELASNEQTIAQLQSKMQAKEGEKSVIASLRADLSLAQDNHDQQLMDVRSQYSSEIEDINAQLETQVTAKRELENKNNNLEDKVLSLESKIAEIEDQSAHQSKSKKEQLFKLMEHADILRKKLSNTSEEISVLKRKLDTNDRTATQLRSKIQSLEEEKLGMSENITALKSELRHYTTEKTAHITELQNCMKEREDALGKAERTISSEAAKHLLQIKDLNATLGDLKKELETADKENNIIREQLLDSKKLFRKQIDDLMLERTQAESKIITLNTDTKALKELMGTLAHDKDQLTEQVRQLSERKEKEINELKRAFDSDRKAQDASIDSLIASKEEELQSMRTTNEELKGQIKKLTEEACQLQRQSESCKAKLEKYQEEVCAAKEESSRLNKKLREATRNYQEKADNLTEHYMKIEDEIRTQLNKARQEKETAERKLAANKKETDRLMDEFYSQKKELRDQLDIVSHERDTLQRKEGVLKASIAKKKQAAKELKESVDAMKDQLQSESKKTLAADKKETDHLMNEFYGLKNELTSRIMKLTDQLDIVSNERDTLQRKEEVLKATIASKEKEAKELQESADSMNDQLQKDLDSLKNKLFEQKSSYECEKKELTSRIMKLTDQLDIVSNERDTLQREEEVLKATIASKEKEAKELQESADSTKGQLRSALKEVSDKAEQQPIQNTNLLHHNSATSKSELEAIVVDVVDSDHVGTDVENEVNATPFNHKKKQKNRKIKFHFDESPKAAKAKANAVVALLSPRAPLTPRISNTHFNFDGWITPRTPRA